jgi:hypothetical protein
MTTLVLPPRYTPDSIALWNAARQAGWSVERLQIWRVPAWLNDTTIVLYGEPLFASVVADALGIALLAPPSDWLTSVPLDYRHREVVFTTLGAARTLTQPRFIKPAEEKCFPAQVYVSGVDLPPTDILPDSTPVLVSEPVTWEVEFRCFIVNRAIATLSPYWRDGQTAQAEDGTWPAESTELSQALAFANTMLADPLIQLPPAVVLDVGRIKDRGWSVVETNAAWGSGIYGCDPAQVLHTIQHACIKTDQVRPGDTRWVLATAPLVEGKI